MNNQVEQTETFENLTEQSVNADNLTELQAQEDTRIAQEKEHLKQEKLRLAGEEKKHAEMARLFGLEEAGPSKKLDLGLCTVEQIRERICVTFTTCEDGSTTMYSSLASKVPLMFLGMKAINIPKGERVPTKEEAISQILAMPTDYVNDLLLKAQIAYKEKIALHNTVAWKTKAAELKKQKVKRANAKLSRTRRNTELLQAEAAELAAISLRDECAGEVNGNI